MYKASDVVSLLKDLEQSFDEMGKIMTDFIIEEQIEKVVNPKTKEYLEEVISSYYNGNYRAAVVVLYTTVIYDLLQKVHVLKNMYSDKGAEEIIENIRRCEIFSVNSDLL